TSASSKQSCKSSTSSSCTSFTAAFKRTAVRANSSVSQAITRRAPALAAAIATTPEPLPTSTTVLPRTYSGFSNNHNASAWPEAQQNVQYGGASIRAFKVGPSICSRGHSSSSKYNCMLGTKGRTVGIKFALGNSSRSIPCSTCRSLLSCTHTLLFLFCFSLNCISITNKKRRNGLNEYKPCVTF